VRLTDYNRAGEFLWDPLTPEGQAVRWRPGLQGDGRWAGFASYVRVGPNLLAAARRFVALFVENGTLLLQVGSTRVDLGMPGTRVRLSSRLIARKLQVYREGVLLLTLWGWRSRFEARTWPFAGDLLSFVVECTSTRRELLRTVYCWTAAGLGRAVDTEEFTAETEAFLLRSIPYEEEVG
jgi:hypothetical protein